MIFTKVKKNSLPMSSPFELWSCLAGSITQLYRLQYQLIHPTFDFKKGGRAEKVLHLHRYRESFISINHMLTHAIEICFINT